MNCFQSAKCMTTCCAHRPKKKEKKSKKGKTKNKTQTESNKSDGLYEIRHYAYASRRYFTLEYFLLFLLLLFSSSSSDPFDSSDFNEIFILFSIWKRLTIFLFFVNLYSFTRISRLISFVKKWFPRFLFIFGFPSNFVISLFGVSNVALILEWNIYSFFFN